MTPAATQTVLAALLTQVPTLPPVAWQSLILRALTGASAALQRHNPLDVQDQARLALAQRLSQAGAHASWAHAPAHAADGLQAAWMACGRWHHDAHVALHASEESSFLEGRPSPLLLDPASPLTQPVARLTALAQVWLDRLTGDPLLLSAALVAEGWPLLATGVEIAP